MLNRADAMSGENCIAVARCVLNVSEYHQTNLFVRIEQMEDPDIPLREDRLSHVTSLRPSFGMYGFDYFRGILLVTFHSRVTTDGMTTTSTCGMTVDRRVLSNSAKNSLLDGRHCLKAMRQLHVEHYVDWIEQHILICVIVREDKVAISKAKEIRPRKLANNVTRIVHCDSIFLDLIKTIMNFTIAFEKE